MPLYRSGSPTRASQYRDRWTTSYADFVTILLTLFVAIAAQATQASMPLAAPTPAPAAAAMSMPKPKRSSIAPAFQKLEREGIKLRLESQGLVITLEQKILFRSGDDRISKEAYPIVAEIGAVLAQIPNRVNLIGHADSRPVTGKRFRDNWELSVARSLRLRELLTGEFGIAEARVSVASLGANAPVSREDSAGALAANRRVEILILDEHPPD
jgi:chemotaxis protein MotB